MSAKYPTDPALIEDIRALMISQGLTNSTLSKMLGIEGASTTFLSKYLNDNLDREVKDFETITRDIIKGIRERIAFGTEIFETSVTKRMGQCFSLIRRTGDIALLTSPAGHGKSSAIAAYCRDNPATVAVTLNATTLGAKQTEGMVFNAVENRDWCGYTSRFSYLVERFNKSGRLLIFDNAQRMDTKARQWLFDFCDATSVPVALIGNPETLDKIRANDQQFSRIGIHAKYELKDSELPAAAQRVAQQFSDADTAEAIADLVAVIAAKPGRLRAVRKTVILAQELRRESPQLAADPRKAIRAAHSRLVRDYLLPGD